MLLGDCFEILNRSLRIAFPGQRLKVGSSSIKLDQQGITISAMSVKIEGELSVEVKSLLTDIDGDGFLTLKGGIISIN